MQSSVTDRKLSWTMLFGSPFLVVLSFLAARGIMLAFSGQRGSGLTDGSGEIGIIRARDACTVCSSISLSTCPVHDEILDLYVGTFLRLEKELEGILDRV
jgi:hypothetical protein